ncbi:MAG: N-acetyltransferase [Rhodospirillales bacterium]|nr:N-acetyltransferase [Alphaproteobacteria bacterium]MBL6948173.1 N-acetyltransferase [Rhodospirillales bacterium]
MPDGREPTTVNVLGSIHEVEAAAWDACVGADNPFCAWGFLSALEDSGSASDASGWLARHLAVRDEAGELMSCAPLYLKSHSYGEYVFDWGWADAFERAGGRYYPKLQCAVPFTPVTGRRLLVRNDLPIALQDELTDAMAQAMVTLGERLGVSSLHVTFPTESEWRRFGEHGLLTRLGQQFHWENRGYADFDGFLAELTSRKRKAIRKERASVAAHGLDFRWLTGSDLSEAHWDAFYRFYRDTTDKKWGQNYLHRDFFSLLGERMGEHVVLVMAEDSGRPVAGALNIRGADTLYGRNWGCNKDFKFLHFEACYYQAIEYAIQHGLKWVEAGAQGPHKVQRGYLPRTTYSAHWIADPGFRNAIEHFIDDERRSIEEDMQYLAEGSPFRKAD